MYITHIDMERGREVVTRDGGRQRGEDGVKEGGRDGGEGGYDTISV